MTSPTLPSRARQALGPLGWLLLVFAATALAFDRIDRRAAALLLHYLAWVGFACALSVAVWRPNPGVL